MRSRLRKRYYILIYFVKGKSFLPYSFFWLLNSAIKNNIFLISFYNTQLFILSSLNTLGNKINATSVHSAKIGKSQDTITSLKIVISGCSKKRFTGWNVYFSDRYLKNNLMKISWSYTNIKKDIKSQNFLRNLRSSTEWIKNCIQMRFTSFERANLYF